MSQLAALAPDWPQISRVLDEALALPVGERASWLEGQTALTEPVRQAVRQLLAVQAGIETGDFLSTLPRLGLRSGAESAPGVDAAVGWVEPQPGAVVGPWRLLSELGQGGMGSVWLAERADGSLKRQVALKLPRLSWARGLAERMARERDILASLEHPHIARLYDAGLDTLGRPWLALEYVQGRPIDEHARHHALSVRQRVGLLLQVCEAVVFAHSRLAIHRDLKPGNILVSEEGQVKLLDFGIAKLLQGDSADATALTEVAGRALTPDYASPEQVRGDALTTASDVYSLGVVAYELLAGVRPYTLRMGSAGDMGMDIDAVQVPAASRRTTDAASARALRGDLDAVLWQALRKDAAERYGTVQQLADDLRRVLADETVSARPEALGARAARFIRRHRLPVAAAAAVALALVGGAAVALWQAHAAEQQRGAAVAASLRAVEARNEAQRLAELAERRRVGAERSDLEAREQAVEAIRQRERADAERSRAQTAAVAAEQAAGQARSEADRANDAARRADQAAQEQRAAAERAEAAKRLLISAFEHADSEAGADATTRAVDVLRAARSSFERDAAEGRAAKDPLLALELRTALAYSFAGLGALADARAVIAPGIAGVEGRLAADDPRRVAALVVQGEIESGDGQPQRALQILQPAIEAARRQGDTTVLVRGLRWLAHAQNSLGQMSAAEASLAEAVRVQGERPDRVPPLEHAQLLGSVANQKLASRAPDALDSALRARDAITQYYHPRRTIAVLSEETRVGLALSRAGRNSEALAQLEKCVTELRATAGPRHNSTLTALNYLGNVQLELGDGAGAYRSFKAQSEGGAAGATTTQPPPANANDALAQLNLGFAALSMRDIGRAIDHLQRAQAGFAATGSAGAPIDRQVRAVLAGALAQAGRFAQAQQTIDQLTALPDRSPRQVAFDALQQGAVHWHRGLGEPAWAAFAPALPVLLAPGNTLRGRTLVALQGLPGALAAGKAAEWLPTLSALRQDVAKAHPGGSNDLVELLVLEAQARLGLAEPGAGVAAEQLREAQLVAERSESPAHVRARVHATRAIALVAAGGEKASAQGELQQAAALMGDTPLAPDRALLQRAQRALAARP